MLRRFLACLSLLLVMGTAISAFAANAPKSRVAPLITQTIDDNRRVTLQGSVHPLTKASQDRGTVASSTPMQRMLLVLKRPEAQDKALAQAIKEMQRPGSKTFHKWLTPEQIGANYGVAQEDINKVTSWLTDSGFNVSSVSKAHSVIEFSGSAQQVASAFRTEIHSYAWNGGTYTANATDPQIPAAIAPVVAGFASLNNFPIKGAHAGSKVVKLDKATKTWSIVSDKTDPDKTEPNKTSLNPAASGHADGLNGLGTQSPRPSLTTTKTTDGGTLYGVTPYDFATIYNVKPLWDAGVDGTGQQIAIVAESDISPSDVDQFRSAFGLPAKQLNILHNGPAPGFMSDQDEASIDVEWSGAVAKNATIDLVVSASTGASAGIYLSMTYAVDNLVAPILSESYQTCESALGPAGNLFYYQTWQQAAAEGITVVVSSGDSAAAGCDIDPYQIASNGLAVNGFASTPYNVAVGGTDFYVNVTNPTPYWSNTNDPATQASALSYIPEVPWNNSCASPEVFAAFAGGSGDTSPAQWCDDPNLPGNYLTPEGAGGGASSCTTFNPANYPNRNYCVAGYPKPDWQSGVNGIVQDNVRDLPDVSFFASYLTFGSAYLYCMTDPVYVPSCNYNTGTGLTYLADGGTSFSAPAFAGVMALVNQKTSSSQGLANYYLYSLASKEYGNSSSPNSSQTSSCNASSAQGAGNSCVFYDVTEGTNALPCFITSWDCINGPLNYAGVLAAYYSTPGYDQVTGLGSVNIENLVNNWATLSASNQATSTTLSASTNLSSYGQPVTLSGSVVPTSGSGTPPGSISIQGMQLNQASIPLVGGSYSQSVSNLLPGVYDITASYVGDGGFLNSVSAPVSMTVAAATATDTMVFSAANVRSGATLPSSNSQIPYGDEVVATVTVQGAPTAPGVLAPTGSVTFSSGGTTLSTVALTGNKAVYQTVAGHVGSYSLTASYSGDSNYNASPAITLPYSEVKAGTSIAANANASAVATGSSVTLTANVTTTSYGTPPSGTVTFTLNGTAVGTTSLVAGSDPVTNVGTGTATLVVPASQIAAGNNQFTATYSGDANYLQSTSSQSAFVSLNGSQPTQMTLTASTPTATNTTPVTILATLTVNGAPVPLGSVNFMDNGKTIAQVPVVGLTPATGETAGTAKLVTRFATGTHQIVAIYSGAGNLLHPNGNGLQVTITGSDITTTSISATNDVGSPANYDVTAMVIAGGMTPPTGTLSLQEPSLNAALNSVSLPAGKAVFGPASEIPVASGSQNAAIITGDFNGDGIMDFAATSANLSTQLMVSLGNGDGTFKAAIGSVVTTDPTLNGTNGLVTGDFNADGISDIVVGFVNGNYMVVMLGNGDGTFQAGQLLAVPPVAGGFQSVIGNLITSDFNSDGIQDIAFANDGGLGTSSIEVFFGVGNGTFSNSPAVIANVGDSSAPSDPVNIVTGDVNNDGKADIVTFVALDGTVGVLLGNGDGTFQNEVVYPVGSTPELGALGDMNHDGFLDIVAPNVDSQNISVLINNHDGTFASAVNYQTASIFDPPQYYYPEPINVALGDLNNDGNTDVVIANKNIGQVSVLYGKADGTLQQFTPWLVNTAAGPYQVLLADLNNDGNPDIIVNEPISQSVGVLLNGWSWSTNFLNVPLAGSTSEKETLTGTYSGDTANLASTSAPLTLAGSGTKLATKLDWTPSSAATVYGTVIPAGTLNAQVENNVPGTITYVAQPAGGAAASVGSATVLPQAGAYSLTATFTPTNTNDYATSTAVAAFNVTKASVSESLTSSIAQAAQGSTVALTDVLVSKTAGTPTGVVTFYAGTNSLGSATIDQTGTATLTTASLPLGTSSITANYMGDINFNSDTAPAITVVTGSPYITFAAGSPALTISSGSTGTESLTVTPQLGYTGTVAFTCGSLPAGATCSFAPASGTIGAGPLQSTLTISTTAPSSTASSQSKHVAMLVSAGAFGLASVFLLGMPNRRKRAPWMALLLIVGSSAFYTGCGGSSKKVSTPVPSTSTIALTSSAIKNASGSSLTLNAALSGTNAATATGTITFYEGTTKIGQTSVASGAAQLSLNTLSVGAHGITAQYAGDSLNDSATSNGIEQVITGQASFTVTATSGSISQTSTVNLTLQ